MTDAVYGHKDGLALTFDVHHPAQPNGAGVISIVSGGYQSSVEMGRLIAQGGFEGADLARANATMVQWFERHLKR